MSDIPQELARALETGGPSVSLVEIDVGDEHVGLLRELPDLEELVLYDCKLVNPPDDLFANMKKLVRLDLSFNRLKSIPSSLGALATLRSLDLVTSWRSVPPLPDLSGLVSLEEANLSGPHKSLPPSLWQLTALTSLDVAGNKLKVLPPEVGNLSNLEVLRLSHGKFTELPESISKLQKLEILELHSCPLESLPIETLLLLPKLERLSFPEAEHLDAAARALKEARPNLELDRRL